MPASRSLRRQEQGRRRSRLRRATGNVARGMDDRLHVAGPLRKQLVKAFPEHWSFMLGEIALYSLIILILTGTYLTFFYDPSDAMHIYHGSYAPLDGVDVTRAFSSSLDISFDVRGGLLIRQIHHWAALLFFASIGVHMCRVFFTGGFRKPREINWLIGLSILAISIIEGYAGYSLPDDLLSGAGLRVGYSVLESIPVIGTWAAYLLFGGAYPGHDIFQRLYIFHVLLFPGLIIALVAAHITIIVRQKHTDFAGVGRTEKSVAGEPMFPIYAAKSGGFFFLVAGVLGFLGGTAQINPIWLWGPYDPARVSANSQPDFFAWFLEGSLRIFPPWEIRGAYEVPPLFWAGLVIPTAMFVVPALYPFVEAFVKRDHGAHHVLQRPRDAPVRTGLGVMGLTFMLVLSLSATDDIVASYVHLNIENVVYGLRVGCIVLPVLAFVIARRICRRLQEHDRLLLTRGIGTGQIRRLPDGTWAEVTRQVNDIGSREPEPVPYRVKVP